MSLAKLCLLRAFFCNFIGDIEGEQVLSELVQLRKVQLDRCSYGRSPVWLCITPGFWCKYIECFPIYVEQLKRWNYLHQLQHATGRNSIYFWRRCIGRKRNPCQDCLFNLNKCKRNLDPNTGSLNLNMHCPGKLKDFRNLSWPQDATWIFFICLTSFFFPYTSFQ